MLHLNTFTLLKRLLTLSYATQKFCEVLVKTNNGVQIYNGKTQQLSAHLDDSFCSWGMCSKGWNTWIFSFGYQICSDLCHVTQMLCVSLPFCNSNEWCLPLSRLRDWEEGVLQNRNVIPVRSPYKWFFILILAQGYALKLYFDSSECQPWWYKQYFTCIKTNKQTKKHTKNTEDNCSAAKCLCQETALRCLSAISFTL